MDASLQAAMQDADWQRLLEAERSLQAQIDAAQAQAQERIAQAQAAASALPDAASWAALAAAQEQQDQERHRGELSRLAEQADAAARKLQQAPQALVDELARQAWAAVLGASRERA